MQKPAGAKRQIDNLHLSFRPTAALQPTSNAAVVGGPKAPMSRQFKYPFSPVLAVFVVFAFLTMLAGCAGIRGSSSGGDNGGGGGPNAPKIASFTATPTSVDS